MRITTKLLHRIAEETVAERVKADGDILAAYLHGSVLHKPLLGGAADIDLFFIYAGEDDSSGEREIVRLTDEVHLDISHHGQGVYSEAKELRSDPWLGHTIYDCKILHDPEHFLTFTQAGVRGMFNTAEFVLARAEPQLDAARAAWFRFYNQAAGEGPEQVMAYLDALEGISNAVACLTAAPLTERRLLLDFPGRAEAAGAPGLHAGLLGLLGAADLDRETVAGWLPEWEDAYEMVADLYDCPPSLHAHRKVYYGKAFQGMLEGGQHEALLWPLMRTWTRALLHLGMDAKSLAAWTNACDHLNLLGAHFGNKVKALDAYLDLVEELFETWKAERGL